MRHLKSTPQVHAGSMADIAFLLLIFFLVTATIPKDQGINRMLPKDSETPTSVPINERNILRITVNNNNEIMLDNEVIALKDLKEAAKNFHRQQWRRKL